MANGPDMKETGRSVMPGREDERAVVAQAGFSSRTHGFCQHGQQGFGVTHDRQASVMLWPKVAAQPFSTS